MPSASTTRPLAGSAAIESSLCERTIPGSVQVAISSVCVRSICSEFQIHFRRRSHRRAQRTGEMLCSLEALVRVLGECPFEEAYQSFGHLAERADVGLRVLGRAFAT